MDFRRPFSYLVAVSLIAQPLLAQTAATPATNNAAQNLNLRFDGREYDGYSRILLNWSRSLPSQSRVTVNGSLVVITLPIETNANPIDIKAKAPNLIVGAALGQDKKTIRLALARNVRIVRSRDGNTESIDFVTNGAPDPAPYSARVGLVEPVTQDNHDAPPAARYSGAELRPLVNWPAPKGAPRVKVESSESGSFTRISISGQNFGQHMSARKGDRVAITIPGLYALDTASLRSHLPKHVKDLVRYNSPTHTSLVMDVDAGSIVRDRRENDMLYIDIMPAGTIEGSINPDAPSAEVADTAHPKAKEKTKEHPKEEAKSAQEHHAPSDGAPHAPEDNAAPPPSIEELASNLKKPTSENTQPDPAPSGRVNVSIKQTSPNLVLDFGFNSPAPAAIFRRGGNIFILFATRANFVLPNLPNTGMISSISAVKGDGVAGVKIAAPDNVYAVPSALGEHWYVGLANAPSAITRTIAITGERAPDATSRIKAIVPDAIANASFEDPDVGDTILVGMALGPPSTVPKERNFIEANVIQSWHGLAIVPRADDMELRLSPDGFVLVRPNGMKLANVQGGQSGDGFATNAPGFVDYENWKLGPAADFAKNLDRLKKQASEEVSDPSKGFKAQLDLARFYLAWELSEEALGTIRAIKDVNPEAQRSSDVIALQGIAQTTMHRGREALQTLSQIEVSEDPASQLWAAIAAIQAGDPSEARKRFFKGQTALGGFTKEQQAKFILNEAIAAMQLEDYVGAATNSARAKELAIDRYTKEYAALIEAQANAKSGKETEAIAALADLEKSLNPEIRARAILSQAMIKVAQDPANSTEAIRALDSLRYVWRGDDLELDVLRNLGELYINSGDIRSGLSTLADASTLRPELPAARALRDVLAKEFRHLFLEGGADGMDPIQALALFYDFRNLTPIGPEGDQMARGLADRLVRLDLLSQATALLKHQVDNRLQGFAKAQVATDLAAVYILDHKPEDALSTIWASRITQLPTALNDQRRLIEAISLSDLGRHDHALEILEFDNTKDASRVKTEVFWRKGDYASAAEYAKQTLPVPAASLTPADAGEVLRAGIAMSLSGDRAGAMALARPYGQAMNKSAFAEAFRIVTTNQVPGANELRSAVQAVRGSSPFDKLVRDLRSNIITVSTPVNGNEQVATGPTDGNPNAARNGGIAARADIAGIQATDGAPKAATPQARPKIAPKVARNAPTQTTAPSQQRRVAQNAPRNGVQAPRDPQVIGAR